MKCGDCKFWREEEAAEGDWSAMGGCHRAPPRPAFESLLVASEAGREATIAKEDKAEVRPVVAITDYWQRRSVWPVTSADDFCGEFAPTKQATFV